MRRWRERIAYLGGLGLAACGLCGNAERWMSAFRDQLLDGYVLRRTGEPLNLWISCLWYAAALAGGAALAWVLIRVRERLGTAGLRSYEAGRQPSQVIRYSRRKGSGRRNGRRRSR